MGFGSGSGLGSTLTLPSNPNLLLGRAATLEHRRLVGHLARVRCKVRVRVRVGVRVWVRVRGAASSGTWSG